MQVSIVSPEQEVWRGDADMVVARSPEGEFGIMQGHIPFLAALVPGRVAVVSGNDREEFFVPGGFLEASGSRDDYHVIVLADSAENLAEIDVAEARRIAEEAQRRHDEDTDERAEAEMRIALARVEIAESRGQ
ncbi:MAG TPA: ATP synthase F1 subunit epsilon [Actinomycetota bacterium]|nr:ATP synthase F1 subunit epsilon [Actinomycetota bacterium]